MGRITNKEVIDTHPEAFTAVETVHVDWVEEHVFLLRGHFGFPIVMTQPNGANGADLLPLTLIGCAAWDVMDILKKTAPADYRPGGISRKRTRG
jgi:hypothetical protein